MKIFEESSKKPVAQGDLLVRRVSSIPAGAKETPRENGKLVVGFSETSHHHSIHDKRVAMFTADDPLVCYLRVEGLDADLVHERMVNPHEGIRLPPGCYEVRRQREWTPEGWRAVQD
jgi:hypothetical protein